MNQGQWVNDFNGPGPMMPPYFMDGMSVGGPPMSGPPIGPQMPGPQMTGPLPSGPQLPGPMSGGDKDIQEVVMEDQDEPSQGGPKNNKPTDNLGHRSADGHTDFRGNRKRDMPGGDKRDERDFNNRDNRGKHNAFYCRLG